MRAEDPEVQFREKVQEVPPSAYAAVCTHRTCCQSLWRLHCQGVNLEVAGVPGPPRCLNQTPSKGQKAFAHHLPQGELHPPPRPHTQRKERHHKDGPEQIREREEREERNPRVNNTKKEKTRLGREENKLKVIKQGRDISRVEARRKNSQVFMRDVLKMCKRTLKCSQLSLMDPLSLLISKSPCIISVPFFFYLLLLAGLAASS